MNTRNESAISRYLRVARGELIGLLVRIAESTDPTLAGVEGVVVDETLNTFLVQREDGKQVHVAKSNNVFDFLDEDGAQVRIAGDRIRFRPEDRIKRVR